MFIKQYISLQKTQVIIFEKGYLDKQEKNKGIIII